jgi:hypothetical protein
MWLINPKFSNYIGSLWLHPTEKMSIYPKMHQLVKRVAVLVKQISGT